MYRVYMSAANAEKELHESRLDSGITEETEKILVSQMVKSAKLNMKVGDKLLLVIDPKMIHIPGWQRRLNLKKAYEIGNSYNKYKWEVPKVLYYANKLWVIDGQHRIYGTFKGGKDSVVVEVIECSMAEAIELFITQSEDRTRMRPCDIYSAAVAGGKEDYIKLQEICHKNNVAVRGDCDMENAVGTLTSISDGINLVRRSPKLLDAILKLLGDLKWNGYADSYNGKAYTAKVIRSLKAMYAYFDGREKEMEKAMISACSGTEFFVENVMDKTQAQIFDYLCSVVYHVMESPFNKNKTVIKVADKKPTRRKNA